MSKTQTTRAMCRSASESIALGGTTAEPIAVQPAVQAEPIEEQLAEQDPIDSVIAELAAAIDSPETFTAQAIADANQVSSATIRNRWSAPVADAISPYSLRAKDGRYTAIAAVAFQVYRHTVAIAAATKADFVSNFQSSLPARQPALIETIEAPEGLAIVPWFASRTDALAVTAEVEADSIEAIVAEVVWQSTAAEVEAEDLERRERLAEVARQAARDYAEEQSVYSTVKTRLAEEQRTAKKQARSRGKSVA